MIFRLSALLALSAFTGFLASDCAAQPSSPEDSSFDRPNILWITVEDMSPTLGCYGDTFAKTPNLDTLARYSTRYSHAFASSPVCSPSRSCLIHGCAAPTTGTHPMRSSMPLPVDMKGLPALLRQSGYFTTNSVKTDYNTGAAAAIVDACWDINSATADWRSRSAGQPFFSVINLMTTHQSRTMVWPYEQFRSEIQSQLGPEKIADPRRVPLPPYYPDTPTVRKTVARYYDCVAVMDGQVGEILGRLDDDGLSDSTIVFFYSDHGSGLPRHKRALLDSGMKVPLMVRIPERFRKWAPTEPGEWSDRLVSFADFGPTVLSLAGLAPLPDYVRGKPFLGPLAVERREHVFGHRDRVDEIMDKARSIRSRDFLYIRNYMPHRGYNQQNAWCDQGEIRADFYALAESGNATAAQAQYLNGSRLLEELYDCRSDPLNLVNLAESAAHQSTLQNLRDGLRDHLLKSRDLGFVPEIELERISDGGPTMQWAFTKQYAIDDCLSAAELVGTRQWAKIRRAVLSDNVSVRFWGAMACEAAKELDDSILPLLRNLLRDSSIAVRIRAASALVRHGDADAGYEALEKILATDNPSFTQILHATRAVELLADPSKQALMQSVFDRFENVEGDMAWFIRFSTTGYLNRLPESRAK